MHVNFSTVVSGPVALFTLNDCGITLQLKLPEEMMVNVGDIIRIALNHYLGCTMGKTISIRKLKF